MTSVPTELDFEIDVLLDDLPDVAGNLADLRAAKPALWARGFGEPALLLLTPRARERGVPRRGRVPGGRRSTARR